MIENKGFRLNKELGYFKNQGVDVMAFDDIYPSGHQSGVSILMHGKRVATNGDIRFEQTPGQSQAGGARAFRRGEQYRHRTFLS